MKRLQWKSMLIAGALTLCCASAAQAGWETTTTNGTPVLSPCNARVNGAFPVPPSSSCLLTGNTLIGSLGSGYILKQSRAVSLVTNGVTIGTYYDRVYCIGIGSTCTTVGTNANTYVLGARVHLNANLWGGASNRGFRMDDFSRYIKQSVPAEGAYWMGPDTGGNQWSPNPDLGLSVNFWVEYLGRTPYGRWDTLEGTRDNNYIGFRQYVTADDIDGVGTEWSAWYLVKQVCSGGVPLVATNFKMKIWSSENYTIWLPGYQCT